MVFGNRWQLFGELLNSIWFKVSQLKLITICVRESNTPTQHLHLSHFDGFTLGRFHVYGLIRKRKHKGMMIVFPYGLYDSVCKLIPQLLRIGHVLGRLRLLYLLLSGHFELIADSHTLTCTDKFGEIGVEGMMRKTHCVNSLGLLCER